MSDKTNHTIRAFTKAINLIDGIFSMASSPFAPKQDAPPVNIDKYQGSFDSNPVLFWGENNDYPDLLYNASRKAGVLQQGLKVRNQLMYDQGLITYKETINEKGQTVVTLVEDAKVNAWLEEVKAHLYVMDAIRNYNRFGNVFALLKWNGARNYLHIECRKTRWCRLERPNPKSGQHEHVYESAQWSNGLLISKDGITNEQKPWVVKHKLVPISDAETMIKHDEKNFNFMLHLKDWISEDPYGEAPYFSTYENGWLDISSSVPMIKKRLFMYAMTLNYVVYIDDDYWVTVYGKEFLTLTPEKKSEKINDLQTSIENNLLGKDNAFKSLFASLKYTPDGKEKKAIIVEAIDNKLREGTFIPDNLHANGEIVAALGIDACLFGASVFGDKVSSGSGSNIREARLNTIGMMKMDRDLILEPLRIAHKLMGFDTNIKYGFKAFIINTLDGRDPANATTATTG